MCSVKGKSWTNPYLLDSKNLHRVKNLRILGISLSSQCITMHKTAEMPAFVSYSCRRTMCFKVILKMSIPDTQVEF